MPVMKTLEPAIYTFSDGEANPDTSDADDALAELRVRCIKLVVIHFRGPQQWSSRKDANATGRFKRPVALIRHVIPSEVTQRGTTFLAHGPFWPSPTSNSTS